MKIWKGKVGEKCEEKKEEKQTQNNNKQEWKHTEDPAACDRCFLWQLPKHVTFRTKIFCCTSAASISGETAERLENRQVQNTRNIIGLV